MNIVLLAATGRAGRTILHEIISRKHHVTAVARNLEKLSGLLPESPSANVQRMQDDLQSAARIAAIITGADAVVSAFGPSSNDPRYTADQRYTDQLVSVTERVMTAVRQVGVPRLIVVGGCGSLEFSPGVTVLNSGHWPQPYVPIAKSHAKVLAMLRSSEINWTYFNPPMSITPGERTGKFHLGGDRLIQDAEGKSRISCEDYALALVDELEHPAHERTRFTIGYA